VPEDTGEIWIMDADGTDARRVVAKNGEQENR
jgi:hypothetical protein